MRTDPDAPRDPAVFDGSQDSVLAVNGREDGMRDRSLPELRVQID
jgi:hypothetical protein